MHTAGDVSFEEVHWKDAVEQRSGQKQPFALVQELQQAVAAKQQDIDDMLRVRRVVLGLLARIPSSMQSYWPSTSSLVGFGLHEIPAAAAAAAAS
jgi:hypothetical protein